MLNQQNGEIGADVVMASDSSAAGACCETVSTCIDYITQVICFSSRCSLPVEWNIRAVVSCNARLEDKSSCCFFFPSNSSLMMASSFFIRIDYFSDTFSAVWCQSAPSSIRRQRHAAVCWCSEKSSPASEQWVALIYWHTIATVLWFIVALFACSWWWMWIHLFSDMLSFTSTSDINLTAKLRNVDALQFILLKSLSPPYVCTNVCR